MKKPQQITIVIYESKKGKMELRADVSDQTVWATQAQIAELFNIDRTVVTKHIKNIFTEAELSEESVSANFAHTAKDRKVYQTFGGGKNYTRLLERRQRIYSIL